MVVIYGLVTIIVVVLVAFLVSIILDIKAKRRTGISFKESMNLVELPVVTFFNNGVKLNFLIDTGSNISYINSSVIGLLNYTMIESSNEMMGITGEKKSFSMCTIDIVYDTYTFTEEFGILDLDDVYNQIKKESGVTLHGILGSRFFNKYQYILDFETLKAYIK